MARGNGRGSRTSLDIYLDEIGREPLLSREEEGRLARRIRERGDAEALRRLVAGNLRFVVAVAKRYRGRGVPLEDLINEGNLGLMRAAPRFDESRGVRFVSYAVWWVRQAMLAAVRRAGAGPAPKAQDGGRGRAPAAAAAPARTLSLDAPAGQAGDAPLLEVVADAGGPAPDRDLGRQRLRELIERSLAFLPEREERVLRLHYGLDGGPPRSLAEVGRSLGVSRERARQLKRRGLARLRRGAGARELESWAG